VFGGFIQRSRLEYRKLSTTPDQYDSFVKQISAMWATQPHFTSEQLHRISTPTTIADGQYDEAIKLSHDRYMASEIPHARLVILPNVSHFAMLQDPGEFNAAVLNALCRLIIEAASFAGYLVEEAGWSVTAWQNISWRARRRPRIVDRQGRLSYWFFSEQTTRPSASEFCYSRVPRRVRPRWE